MGQETKRVMYEPKAVDVPGLGQHRVIELVEVPYDQRQGLGMGGGVPKGEITQTDTKLLKPNYRIMEIGDLIY